MYRYSTKPFGILLSFNPAGTQEMWLTFVQNDIEITRTKADLENELATVVDNGDGTWEFQFAFSQEESADFSAYAPIQAQVRWKNSEGHSDVTNVYSFHLKDVLKEGVI